MSDTSTRPSVLHPALWNDGVQKGDGHMQIVPFAPPPSTALTMRHAACCKNSRASRVWMRAEKGESHADQIASLRVPGPLLVTRHRLLCIPRRVHATTVRCSVPTPQDDSEYIVTAGLRSPSCRTGHLQVDVTDGRPTALQPLVGNLACLLAATCVNHGRVVNSFIAKSLQQVEEACLEAKLCTTSLPCSTTSRRPSGTGCASSAQNARRNIHYPTTRCLWNAQSERKH